MRVATHFSGVEALRMAMEVERREHRFFAALARKAKGGTLREVFSGMAQDKAALLRSLRVKLGECPDEGFWDNEEEILPYLQRLPEELFNIAETVKKKFGRLSSDREALRLAIEVEERLAEYFRETAAASFHPEGKEVFIWLASEQEDHAGNLREKQGDQESARVPG